MRTVLHWRNDPSRLTHFIDANGILRVGGRLQAASLTIENKHPAILPKNSPLTNLVIADARMLTLERYMEVLNLLCVPYEKNFGSLEDALVSGALF